MGIQVMLSIDLEQGVSQEKRKACYENLADNNWVKIPKVTTTWKASFGKSTNPDKVIEATKNYVKRAASASGVTNYEAVAHLGPDQPISFKN